MYKRSLVVCAGVVTLWMSGCSTGDDASSSSSPSPSVAQSPTATQSFSKPLVAEKNTAKKGAGDRIAGLLQSTDPSERARQVQARIGKRDQKDPFSGLPPVLALNVPMSTTASSNTVDKAGLPPLPTFPKAPEMLGPVATSSGMAKPMPGSMPTGGLTVPKSTIKTLPPLPEPTLAQAVEVSGVIVVGGVPQAIVKAPNESTSRYVGAGQRLSNGQILVKRIEMNSGSDPVVILEQNGVEVPRGVGEKATPTQGGTPTAMVQPVSSTINS